MARHSRLGRMGSMRARAHLIPRPPIYPGRRCLARMPECLNACTWRVWSAEITLTALAWGPPTVFAPVESSRPR